MASITSLMSSSSSSSSSLYGNRNVISGLASGMDTEAMIENSISGYKTKISTLQQKMTKLQWKQDAYRSLITQMNNVLNKYMDYTSSTNLLSSSFFSKAVNTVALGANAAKVAVSGKGTSNVQIDRVKQLAQAASYSVSASELAKKGATTEAIKWNDVSESSAVSGSISFQLGGAADSSKGSRVSISFAEDEVFHNAEEMAAAINEKLGEKTLGTSKANEVIRAVADSSGNITFEQLKGNDHFEITGVSGEGLSEIFEKTTAGSDGTISSKKAITESDLVVKTKTIDYLAEQTINVTLDGKTKSIKLGDIIDEDFKKGNTYNTDKSTAFAKGLQAKLDEAFGEGKVKVEADSNGALQFSGVKAGSTFKISGNDAVNKGLGLGEGGYSNVLQTGWTLERVLGEDAFTEKTDEDGNTYKAATLTINGKDIELKSTDTVQNMMEKINASDANVTVKFSTLTGEFTMNSKETGAESKIKIGGDLGRALFGAAKEIDEATTTYNDVFGANISGSEYNRFRFQIGTSIISAHMTIKETDTIEDVTKKLNNDYNMKRLGATAAFNKETGQFEVTDSNGAKTIVSIAGGSGAELKAGEEYMKSKGSYTAGQDAVFQVTVNGKTMDMSRSSNDVELDGYNVTLKGAFGYDKDGNEIDTEAITFETNTDTDKIVDVVKDFVKDYNELVTALHNAYRTEPLKNTSGDSYDPLTDDDQESMSESAIKAYEDKAKTGLLYADTDLANLYAKLTSAVQGSGGMGSVLRSIGLDVNYADGLTTISLDEDKLRSTLETDPDKVKNAFTQTASSGASANGMMVNLRSTLEQYGKTSIGSPGILVKKAGSTLSSYSLNNNEINDQISSLQKEIEKWQDRMSDRVDYYTNQFTQLELLINQMNSQSSMLAGLSGGM